MLLLNLNRIQQILKNHTEMLAEIRETNNSLLSTKENEVMKSLTILAAITIPASIIASIFNMSVTLPLGDSPYAFWIIIGVMLSISVMMFLLFRHKKWI
jgi:magnesium transporter